MKPHENKVPQVLGLNFAFPMRYVRFGRGTMLGLWFKRGSGFTSYKLATNKSLSH